MTGDYARFPGASNWLQKRDNRLNSEAGIFCFAQRFFAFVNSQVGLYPAVYLGAETEGLAGRSQAKGGNSDATTHDLTASKHGRKGADRVSGVALLRRCVMLLRAGTVEQVRLRKHRRGAKAER